jgi:hypothetical protein
MAEGFKTGGRQKGTPNKMTKALKDMILGALEAKGGRRLIWRGNQAKASRRACRCTG